MMGCQVLDISNELCFGYSLNYVDMAIGVDTAGIFVFKHPSLLIVLIF